MMHMEVWENKLHQVKEVLLIPAAESSKDNWVLTSIKSFLGID